MLMKPGATARPAASIDVVARAAGRSPTRRDAVAPDADVGAAPGAAAAVVDGSAADDDVEGLGLGGGLHPTSAQSQPPTPSPALIRSWAAIIC